MGWSTLNSVNQQFGMLQTRHGEKTGSIICHSCDTNDNGFCTRYNKWCSTVRFHCEALTDVERYGGDPKKSLAVLTKLGPVPPEFVKKVLTLKNCKKETKKETFSRIASTKIDVIS